MKIRLGIPVLAVLSVTACHPRLSRSLMPVTLTLTQAALDLVWQPFAATPGGSGKDSTSIVFVGVLAADLPPGARVVPDSELGSHRALFFDASGLQFSGDSLRVFIHLSVGYRSALTYRHPCRPSYTLELRRRPGYRWTVWRGDVVACA